MPRQKTNAAAPSSAGEQRAPKRDIFSRFVVLAVAAYADYIVNGDEAAAKECRAEIDDLVNDTLTGVARQTVLALVERERKSAEAFAGRLVDRVEFEGVSDIDWNHAEREDRIIEHA